MRLNCKASSDAKAYRRQAAAHGVLSMIQAATVALAVLAGGAEKALAETVLGSTPNGEIYRKKGWDWPAIYRKQNRSVARDDGRAAGKQGEGSPATDKSRLRAGSGKKNPARPLRTALTRATSRRRPRRANRSTRRHLPAKALKLEERSLRPNELRSAHRLYAVKMASLGYDILTIPEGSPEPRSVTGGGAHIRWVASNKCLPGRLRAAINYVARNFGSVRVNSTCRSRRHNRRVGGARRSWHLKGRAADIRVFGNIRKAARYLRSVVGGYKHYGGGLFHIDTGPRRSW